MLAKRSAQVFSRCRRAWRARPVLRVFWMAAGLLGTLGAADAALGAMPVGSEFQVNTYTTGPQMGPAVAVDASGSVVVVWQSDGSAGSDTSAASVHGQRYDASGNAVGPEFQVNTYTNGIQGNPSVGVDADGGFVVAWYSSQGSGSDPTASVQGQRYDASGSAVGAQFQINTYTTGAQAGPSVAVDADGDFVVVWHSGGSAGTDTDGRSVQGQRYDASGNPIGAQFQVNTHTSGDQYYPSVAVDPDGNFVVVWADTNLYPAWLDGGSSIQGQRYDASGNPIGAQFQVNTFSDYWADYYQDNVVPSAAVEADGDFVVVWQHALGFSGSNEYLYSQGQRWDKAGSRVGAQFEAHVSTFPPWQLAFVFPAVDVDAAGNFVVVWQGYGSSGSDTSGSSIQGQRYDASSNAVGAEFCVNTYTTGNQRLPAVAVRPDGDFVVVWDSEGSAGSDTSSFSIQGQRYTVQAPPVPSLSPPAVAGLGLLLFGVAVAGLRGRLRGRA